MNDLCFSDKDKKHAKDTQKMILFTKDVLSIQFTETDTNLHGNVNKT